jgi:peptidoglycan/xylan/chitin deacetylase (PgdA/CDA1 family)
MRPFVVGALVVLGIGITGRNSVALAPAQTASPQDAPPNRRVAITIDDLPKAGGSDGVGSALYVTESILAALERYDVSAVGFVLSNRATVRGQTDARLDMLREWVQRGHELGNHTYSHLPFHGTPVATYIDDAVQGDRIPRTLMEAAGRPMRYFRHPFNSTGPTQEAKTRFAETAERLGYVLTPFTVEHADYAFDAIYSHAHATGNGQLRDSVSRAYLDQLDTAFAFAERMSRETFGREIPQVFLIHTNEINAAHLSRMLQKLTARGYRFVTLEAALEDPAYATEDVYIGRWGWSWFHRWRVGLDMEPMLREEPDPPAWIMEQYEALPR